MSMMGDTVVSPWLPLAVGFALGAVMFPLAIRRFYGSGDDSGKLRCIIGTLLYFAVMIPLGMLLMLGLNTVTSHNAPVHTVEATVTTHAETVNRYRTVGRRRVYQGKEHNYYVDVRLPEGHVKEIRVKPGEFIKVKPGRRARVTLRRGCLGLEVIDSVSFRR